MGKKNKQSLGTIPNNKSVIDGKVKKEKKPNDSKKSKEKLNNSLKQSSKVKVEPGIVELLKTEKDGNVTFSDRITKKGQRKNAGKKIKLEKVDSVSSEAIIKTEKGEKTEKKAKTPLKEILKASANKDAENKILSKNKNIKKIMEKMQKKKHKQKLNKESKLTSIKSEPDPNTNAPSNLKAEEDTKEETNGMEKKQQAQSPASDSPDGSNSEATERTIRHVSKPENTIFVGNLVANTKKKQLESLFKVFGKIVSIRFRTAEGKRMFKHSARLKSDSLIAFVVFDNAASKEKALSLSGTEFKGRHIRVTSATNFRDQIVPKAIVFVGNLKYSATDEKLYEIFSTCGSIEYVRTVRNEKGCAGIGYVCFKKPEAVTLALELNNTLLDDRPMRVQRYKKNPEKVITNPKELKGPARRLLEKMDKNSSKNDNKKKVFLKSNGPKGNTPKGKEFTKTQLKTPKLEKKSDYQGKKIANKKKLKEKKKKRPTHLQKLAKKIAPK